MVGGSFSGSLTCGNISAQKAFTDKALEVGLYMLTTNLSAMLKSSVVMLPNGSSRRGHLMNAFHAVLFP